MKKRQKQTKCVILSTRKTKKTVKNHDDDDNGGGSNRGTLTIDATCAPSSIRYPQDVSLLNEARENTEKLLDVLHDPIDGKKPRSYRKRALKDEVQNTP